MQTRTLEQACRILSKQQQERIRASSDITSWEEYAEHAKFIKELGDMLLADQSKEFIIDEDNQSILRFMALYFSGNKAAEAIFPNDNFKLHKNLMLCGPVGTGKTLIMSIFSKYLNLLGNERQFMNLSITQMVNYYKLNNHLNKYTYNESEGGGFDGNPINVCINDLGMQSHLHFGTDTKVIVNDFLHARNEVWAQQGKMCHITTNLSVPEIKEYFKDDFGRLQDRFKTYNVLYLKGGSKR